GRGRGRGSGHTQPGGSGGSGDTGGSGSTGSTGGSTGPQAGRRQDRAAQSGRARSVEAGQGGQDDRPADERAKTREGQRAGRSNQRQADRPTRQQASRPEHGGRGAEPELDVDAAIAGALDLPAGDRRGQHQQDKRGRTRGRYLMCVHVEPDRTHIAVLEGRSLIEHYVARPEDDALQIVGNVYRGRVKNVLPGMEAAFVDIGTPKNAVLYWGDVSYDKEEIERQPGADRIEHVLRPGQTIVCQVTKNPIGLKGARLTQEVSLPGRFVVLVPQSDTYGISRRLDDNERRRLRRILDSVRPDGHGMIVRTAAAGASADDLRRDVGSLVAKWGEIDDRASRLAAPALLYSEPHMAVRLIREELTEEHRAVLVDDPQLFEIVKSYVAEFDPVLAERVELYDTAAEPLPLFERHHVHEQLHKALDRKVWLPSGGSLIIDRTEALTVIDVNTGRNVGSSSLERTVFENNLEAAEEVARQLRLRDIGGIIVIDFVDMEIDTNRQKVMASFKAALARDKTPTQVYDISKLGLVEMTRKRVGEGLIETMSELCPMCSGRGLLLRGIE
ncbi:MAG: Rne/Rng family ribonuclease, partial [Acidimicrobiales bacterium]